MAARKRRTPANSAGHFARADQTYKQTVMCLITGCLAVGIIFTSSVQCRCKNKMMNHLLVEAVGVESDISIENTQLTDSEKAAISKYSSPFQTLARLE
jgi:hypothetical protein